MATNSGNAVRSNDDNMVDQSDIVTYTAQFHGVVGQSTLGESDTYCNVSRCDFIISHGGIRDT